MKPLTPTVIKIRRAYVRGFGNLDCLACGRKTTGKLCDHVSGSFGNYYTTGVPICPRCYRRVQTAVEKAEQIELEGQR
jgi:hypothetical protein